MLSQDRKLSALINCLIGLILMSYTSPSYAIVTGLEEDQKTQFVIVPGMREYVNCGKRENESHGAVKYSLINPATEEHVVVSSDPPVQMTDIGQSNCVSNLEKSIAPYLENDKVENIVLYSECQGTATALNYVAKNPKKIKALILEGVVGSGNRVIHWRTKKIIPKLGHLPGAEWSLPYVVKCLAMFCYSPSGHQPVMSLAKLPKDLPIVIIHSRHDNMTPYDDALALYYGLSQAGNEQVYLITTDEYAHIHLLKRDQDKEKLTALNQIYKKNKLPYDRELLQQVGEISDAQLKEHFQPDFKSFEPQYKELFSNVKAHQTLGTLVNIGCSSLVAIAGYYYCF